MKFFVDSEFYENGRTIDLISLALVCENGQEFYRQSADADWRRFGDWVRTHVESKLWACPKGIPGPKHRFGYCGLPNCVWRTTRDICRELVAFIQEHSPNNPPEFWGEDCAYDFVVMSWLFGGINGTPGWPEKWPYFFYDIDATANQLHEKLQPAPEDGHHALTDARWIKQEWQRLSMFELTSDPLDLIRHVTRSSRKELLEDARRQEPGTVDQESEAVRGVEEGGNGQVNGSGDQQRELQQEKVRRKGKV